MTASLERLGFAELVDEHFVPHGNWQGISLGKVMTGWLTHILSEADHRMNRVQDWAAKRLETLTACLGGQVRAFQFPYHRSRKRRSSPSLGVNSITPPESIFRTF